MEDTYADTYAADGDADWAYKPFVKEAKPAADNSGSSACTLCGVFADRAEGDLTIAVRPSLSASGSLAQDSDDVKLKVTQR